MTRGIGFAIVLMRNRLARSYLCVSIGDKFFSRKSPMSEISYFQKYTQQENHITNNTLLMFRHLYRYNPSGFQRFLNSMIDDENLEVGLVLQQQVNVEQSVPDGMILQKPFNIYIEAKREGGLSNVQITRHLETAKNKEQSYIIGLTKDPLSAPELEQYKVLCRGEGVGFAAITYTDLVYLLKAQAKDHETDLIEIINDYEQFLLSERMMAEPFRMLCVACNDSFAANVEHEIYYEPARKPDKTFIPFIGIYQDKKITHFGKIKTSIIAIYERETLNIEGECSALERDRILQLFESVTYHRQKLVNEPHRYYIIENLIEVNLKKISLHGIRISRYLDLKKDVSKELRTEMTMAQIADIIKDKPFQ